MSAFICSDKHIATIARAIFTSDCTAAQQLADRLKRENIRSVNHRYNERTRMIKCNITKAAPDDAYTIHDISQLVDCLHYQSCEGPDAIRDIATLQLIQHLLELQGADSSKAKPNLWAI